ncbi:MAG: RES family NAD+ phosphorylase [Methylococcaceae bacterium]|nr:RES family NAD+ phosphorylase [Methylococcaceae bacterium]
MAEWFDQSRYKLNGNSTRESVDFVASLVDDARHMARIDSPPREPVEIAWIAKAAIGELFRDAPAATVLKAAGLSEPAMQRAIDGGRFARGCGDDWIAQARTAVLRVPSILVPDAFNYLLNPAHPAAAEARLIDIKPFSFDARLWGLHPFKS